LVSEGRRIPYIKAERVEEFIPLGLFLEGAVVYFQELKEVLASAGVSEKIKRMPEKK
jgi:hypothetical protein